MLLAPEIHRAAEFQQASKQIQLFLSGKVCISHSCWTRLQLSTRNRTLHAPALSLQISAKDGRLRALSQEANGQRPTLLLPICQHASIIPPRSNGSIRQPSSSCICCSAARIPRASTTRTRRTNRSLWSHYGWRQSMESPQLDEENYDHCWCCGHHYHHSHRRWRCSRQLRSQVQLISRLHTSIILTSRHM